jgi:hypothetical protein
LTTNQKGLFAETAIIHERIRLGIGVCPPAPRSMQVGAALRRRRMGGIRWMRSIASPFTAPNSGDLPNDEEQSGDWGPMGDRLRVRG